MERSSAGSNLVFAEGPPFLAIGPMDKNAQLHGTFRWWSYPVFNNSVFCARCGTLALPGEPPLNSHAIIPAWSHVRIVSGAPAITKTPNFVD